ncbi:MAG TPA: hypothetical protein VKR31_06590 [Rhizomicrobium sp.]|nr:hypothetical protein [Rhizomicrobium sp.]
MKTILLATTAVIALTAGGVAGGVTRPTMTVHGMAVDPMKVPAGTLYNQNSSANGGAVCSQNFTSGSFSSIYNCAGADDFILASPATMIAVDASGVFYNGSGPAKGARAVLYTGGKVPKAMLATANSTSPGPNVTVGLKHKLKAGKHYWISVVVNCSYTGGCGQWAWETRHPANFDPAVWEDPGSGGKCSTWKPLRKCVSSGDFRGDDFLFDIRGK